MTTQPEAAVEVLRSRGIIEPVEVGISVGPQLGALAEVSGKCGWRPLRRPSRFPRD